MMPLLLRLRRRPSCREPKPLRRAPRFSVTAETLEARLLLSTYNAAADFSATSNPNGVWSYGWSSSLGSTFNLDNYHGHDVDATHVEDDWHPSDNAYPLVFYNPLSVSYDDGSNILQPGQLALHPSDTDGYAVVRFTAPSDVSASVQATFSSVSIPGATSDAHVLLDGVPLFGGPVYANLSQTFTETIAVKQGDTIDFAVGDGGNGHAYDGTGLSAQITLNSPDIAATSLTWDTSQGEVDYGYTISGSDLPQATTVDLDWASGTTVNTVIGSPIISTTTATALGTYQLHATPSQLGTPPAGATYLLVVADPGNLVSPADPSKVASLALSSLMVTTQPPNIVGLDNKFDVQVSAEYSNGNVETSFNGPVTIAVDNNPGGATLGGTLTVNAVNGVADFPDLTLNKAGSGYTLKATSAGLTSVDTGSFSVAYIVTNTNDSGPGSLRDMITAVDADPIANGPDQITFASNISGGTLSLQSPLPAPTRNQVTITGPITLDGTSAGGDGLDISGNQDSVQNVTVMSFSGNGISVTGNDDSITGSQITGDQIGIDISGGATGNTIGGTAAGAGDVIGGNLGDGIDIVGADTSGNTIAGDLIGASSAGSGDTGNEGNGITIIDASNNTIGGESDGAANVIDNSGEQVGVAIVSRLAGGTALPLVAPASSTPSGNGIFVMGQAANNLIQGDYIGITKSGQAAGNSSSGVVIQGASNNTIGGTKAGDRNYISANGQAGVLIMGGSDGTPASGNMVQGNYIGTNTAGKPATLGNTDGVLIETGASNNTIGALTSGPTIGSAITPDPASNIIAGNNHDGVVITATTASASGNRVSQNQIY